MMKSIARLTVLTLLLCENYASALGTGVEHEHHRRLVELTPSVRRSSYARSLAALDGGFPTSYKNEETRQLRRNLR
jgi:hypothetical protein